MLKAPATEADMNDDIPKLIAIWVSEPRFDPTPGTFTFLLEGAGGERLEVVLTQDAAKRAAELVVEQLGA